MSEPPTDHRVLPPVPYTDLGQYVANQGGVALQQARAVEPVVLIEELTASGLRGRGGAGFPTGVKWRTVTEHASDVLATTVAVNAAEGEPGTFKDRHLLDTNPYAVLEGALIAAEAMRANEVIVAIKGSFGDTVQRLRGALDEVRAAGWLDAPGRTIEVRIVEGPDRYLFGEETAMLEVIDGRPPLPRVAPPYRHGTVEVVTGDRATEPGPDAEQGAADVVMASAETREAPPTLANNVETLANVPAIIRNGAQWFRQVGTEQSPGTVLATLTGNVRTPGVYEVPLGTPLDELIELAGGSTDGTHTAGVLCGVSTAFLADLSAAVSYEAMEAAGSGLGSASFRLIDADDDPLALAAGVSRFLAVESCGQCTPCKIDGLAIAESLERLCANEGTTEDADTVSDRLATVADGARCALGRQHQTVVSSILEHFPDAVEVHLSGSRAATAPRLIGATVWLDDEGERIDESIATADAAWSGLQTGPDNPPE